VPLTIFTSSVSLTPGTVSVELSEDRKWLYVHALHLEDEQELIDLIKARYEAPLKEIFGC
jgi:multicomponent K+:H+ antiporter subunit E